MTGRVVRRIWWTGALRVNSAEILRCESFARTLEALPPPPNESAVKPKQEQTQDQT